MESRQNYQDKGFLPNFCDVTTLFMLVLLVELLALVLTLVSDDWQNFWNRLSMISLFSLWLALVNAALLCGLRNWLNARSIVVNALTSFSIMLLVTLLISLALVYAGTRTGIYPHADHYFVLRNLAIAAVIYAVVLRYFYIQHQWMLNIEAQSHAQLQALKARIRPHFLFNSMNTIASLIHIDADRAEKAVEDLADLFRASLKEKTVHTLEDEMALTRSYLDIENLRLGHRLQVEWQLGDIPLDMEIPALCLQPLVENAIYYGIEPMADGGTIKISAQIDDNRLCLSINNPLNKRSRIENHKSNHMAQDNIRKRLDLMYGGEASFQIEAIENAYTVTLRIPVQADT